MDFEYLISDNIVNVSINKKDGDFEVSLGDELIQIKPIHLSAHFISLIMNGVFKKIYFAKDNGVNYIFIDGQQYCIEDLSKTEQKSVAKDHLLLEQASEICAPMPGKILKIYVKEGDTVEVKQNLIIVEAMKMENSIHSSIKGKVKKVNFKEGDIVDTGQPIIELEKISDDENNK